MATFKRMPDGTRLATSAAASRARALADGLPPGGVRSALRTRTQQERLFLSRYRLQATGRGPFRDVRQYKGKRYVRFSADGMVAVPGTSRHETGLALDIGRTTKANKWMTSKGLRYGWRRTIASEPWHFEYDVTRDKVRAALGTHVTTENLNVRAAPSTKAEVRKVLRKNTRVSVVRIQTANGRRWATLRAGGFVAAAYLRKAE